MENNKSIGFVSFEDGTGNVLKIDLPQSKRKKYRMLTIVSMVGYLDFEPEKTKHGNDKDYGTQIIFEKHKVMNKYLITNNYFTQSEHLYTVLDVTLKTVINPKGEYTSTLTTTKSSGKYQNKLEVKSEEIKKINYNELSEGHKSLLNKVIEEIKDTEKAFAVAYKNRFQDYQGFIGGMGLYDFITAVVKKKLPNPVITALTLTNYSIKYTPASGMRLNLYNYQNKIYGDLTKPIND